MSIVTLDDEYCYSRSWPLLLLMMSIVTLGWEKSIVTLDDELE
jgi:hypothetical protein